MDPLIVGKLTHDYIQNALKPDSGFLAILRDFAVLNNVPIISHEVKKLLEVVLMQRKTTRILEIGTAIGYSAIFFSESSTIKPQIDTIEVDQEMVLLARENILKAGLNKSINVICGDALEVLSCLTGEYDMIFLDGPKAKYMEMLSECLRLLSTGGLLITDNVLYRGFVATDDSRIPQKRRALVRNLREYIEFLCTSDQLETSIIPIGDGVALSVKRGLNEKD